MQQTETPEIILHLCLLKMFVFLIRIKPPQEEPWAGPSGSIPEEGVVITGNDSPTGIISPEDLPMGQGGGGRQ